MTQPDYDQTFSPKQLSKYFDHIHLPQKYRGQDVPRDLTLLTALHIHHIAAIPYENLSLHYSQQKTIDLDPQVLFTKIVQIRRNRGGYCMEGSVLFLHVITSLGFEAYPTVVRIRFRVDGVPVGEYMNMNHIVIIIELNPSPDSQDVEKYVCDVAFGGDGPTRPMPFKTEVITQNLGSQEIRFARKRIPKSRKHDFWIYEYRNSPERPWNSFYAFNDTEFLETDFTVVNYYTSQGPTFQKTTVMIVKFVLGENENIIGKLMLVNGVVKRNMGGRTEVVEECTSESQRIKALEKWFGITLTDEETAGIKNTVTELKEIEVIAA
ncbi:hypothetical protein VPNG_06474 [Cytospora leucostoma]|uniref:Uncharacterized protein n=1 Tax=Cytospora leucostoma TaxID=1230097 RepID=A0A423WZ30_9PEZI|nr:hypothetical protein VPNG_06474 [Cytospora leucostoma]